MPNIKSAKKRVKTSERNRLRNVSQISAVRTAIRAVREATNETEALAKLPDAFSKIDKAIKRKVIHKNAGARLKSRLITRVRKTAAK